MLCNETIERRGFEPRADTNAYGPPRFMPRRSARPEERATGAIFVLLMTPDIRIRSGPTKGDAGGGTRLCRVSTQAQDLEPQLRQLRAAGCTEVFEEKASGTSRARPE